MSEPIIEEGVCVCCRAAASLILLDAPGEPGIPVCEECRDDGTLKAWLEVQIRLAMVESGYTFATREGIEYATAPKRLDDGSGPVGNTPD